MKVILKEAFLKKKKNDTFYYIVNSPLCTSLHCTKAALTASRQPTRTPPPLSVSRSGSVPRARPRLSGSDTSPRAQSQPPSRVTSLPRPGTGKVRPQPSAGHVLRSLEPGTAWLAWGTAGSRRVWGRWSLCTVLGVLGVLTAALCPPPCPPPAPHLGGSRAGTGLHQSHRLPRCFLPPRKGAFASEQTGSHGALDRGRCPSGVCGVLRAPCRFQILPPREMLRELVKLCSHGLKL